MAKLAALIVVLAVALASWPPVTVAAAPLPQVAPCATAAAAALAQRGKPYVWGAKGPETFDCSGLTQWAWAQAGYRIGPSTYDQVQAGVPIPCTIQDLQFNNPCWEPGDLIFLRYSGGQHVAMYIGNGLFADAYNRDTGVIVHRVQDDSFYAAHFWQARRIVDCNGTVQTTPITPDLPSSTPGLEELPNLIAPVSYQIPQCGTCDPNGVIFLPPTKWEDSWPRGWEALNPTIVFQKAISWLAWQVRETIRILICWLFSMLQILANALSFFVNTVTNGVNAIWKILIFLWLTLREWFYAFWDMFEWFRELFYNSLGALAYIGPVLLFIVEVFMQAGALISLVLGLLWQLVSIGLGVIGWVGGLVLGFITLLLGSLNGTGLPQQIDETHIVYRLVRGGLEAVVDSKLRWLVVLAWALPYVGLVWWLSRFFSEGKEA